MASEDVVIRVGADTSGLDGALRSSAAAIQSFAGGAQSAIGGLGTVFTNLTGTLGGVGLALGGITAVLGAVGTAIQVFGGRATEIATMASTIGFTTDQFQALRVAADEVGVSIDKVARVVEKLTVLLNDARNDVGSAIGKLHELGITNDQIHDSQFSVNDMLALFRARLNDASTATDTHNALLKEFGVRGAQAIEVIKNYDGSQAGVAKTMEKVNGLTVEQIKDLKAAYAGWKEFGENISNIFSKALIAAHEFYGFISKYGSMAGPGGGGAPAADPAKLTGTIDRGEGAQKATEDAQKAADAQIAASHAVTDEMLKDLKQQIAETAHGTAARLELVKQFYTASLAYYGKDTVSEVRSAHTEMINEERAYQTKRTAEAKTAEAHRIAIEREGTAAIRAETAITEREISATVAESSKMLESMVKVRESESQAFNDMKLGEISASEKALSEELKDGQVSATQYLSQERDLIEQRLAEWRRFYSVKGALALDDEVGQAQAATGIAKAEATALKERQVAENTSINASLTQWRAFSTAIESSVTHAISGMIQGTMTFASAMRSIFTSVIDHIIQQLVRMLAQSIENSIVQATISKTTGAQQIATNAAVGATAAGASVAAIPFYGWAAAAGVMAAMFALASSYSAEGGFDVPNISPLVQLHPREMVLPQEHADTIRDMKGGAGGGDITLNVSAIDSRAVSQMLTDHRSALAQALRDHMRSQR